MIQLSLLLLLLTLQTTIQASDPNELQISTYEEWQAQEAKRQQAEYAQILEDIREKHMKQRATEEEKKAGLK